MKKKLFVLAALMALALSFAMPLSSDVEAASSSAAANFRIEAMGGHISETPHLEKGEIWSGGTLRFSIIDSSNPLGITLDSVDMSVNIDITVFPFDIAQVSYLQAYGVGGVIGDDISVDYKINPIRVRGDAPAGFYDVPFILRYHTGNGASRVDLIDTLYMRVLVADKGAQPASDSQIAKVIVSASSTNPTEVVAGENFVLGVSFKNTSATHTISNLKASLAADSTFKPVSGSSTLFISSIAPGETKSASLRLTSKSDTAPGSYTASFSLNYDAPNTKDHAPVTDTETIAIPVKQVPHVMTTKLQIQPSEIYVGQDINVMSTVNNTGKSKIYNLNVTVDDGGGLLASADAYLGNVDSGGTGTVDMYIKPVAEGSGTVTMHVSYEDENGAKYTAEEKAEITVLGNSAEAPMDVPVVEPVKSGGSSWWIWLIAAAIVAGIALAITLKKRAAKKRTQRDRDEVKALNEKYLKENARGGADESAKEDNGARGRKDGR